MPCWHAESCKESDIAVDDGLARGQACRAMPGAEGLVDQQKRVEAGSGLPRAVPKDEPRREMSLFWPDCVHYAGRQDQEGMSHHGQQGTNNSRLAESMNAPHASTRNVRETLPGVRQSPDTEFRRRIAGRQRRSRPRRPAPTAASGRSSAPSGPAGRPRPMRSRC